jgi:hypothetical protein
VSDAQYDVHFERNGVPLSAIEVHEAVRKDGGRGVVKVKGPRRRRMPMEDPDAPEATVGNYWWVSYQQRMDSFTHPHWSGGGGLVVYDNVYFRRGTWTRPRPGDPRAPHWAYGADAFVRTRDRYQIEWTPNVPALRVSQRSAGLLTVQMRSCTPNFDSYRVRTNGAKWRRSGETARWQLRKGRNTFEVCSRNLFGVEGPTVSVVVDANHVK